MKKALIGAGTLAVLAIIGVVLLSGQKKAESTITTTDIAVAGMSCQGCVDKVSETLSKLEGVKEVRVSLKEGLAHVKYDAALVTLPAMEQSITKLGYTIGNAETSSKPEKKHECAGEKEQGCCTQKSSTLKT
ncbi:MAG: heavy-metal-associated domain-containing protein [candidate division KSB1 bacterium]|nr:heavy-metal-associated domain-containing protein [candidate division KSB1 bacterium]MDZ7302061.1 heavy-metal-associated domain-containing protein [candidate division KSB1 bacterium]MDZ7311103.1 heavy-metal-associated domain-containing protein [candidate division KSB1 bacterium]